MTICITVNEMQLIFESLIQKLKNDNIKSVEVETDYYWVIASDEWENFESPPEACVGSLVDDWESLKKTLEAEHIATYVDHERFASILRAISEKIAPSEKCSH
ncbi:MAG: hypothetical protein WBG70_12060 [Spirulinaceae cyanobacterium]